MWLITEYSATWRHTSVAGDMLVSRKGHGSSHECKVAPRINFYSSLTEWKCSVGGVLFFAAATVYYYLEGFDYGLQWNEF